MTYSYRLPSGDQFAEMITNKIAPAAFIDLINIVNEDGRYNNPEIVRKFTETINAMRIGLINKEFGTKQLQDGLYASFGDVKQESPEHIIIEQTLFAYSKYLGEDEHIDSMAA